jgi:hypothetical protein
VPVESEDLQLLGHVLVGDEEHFLEARVGAFPFGLRRLAGHWCVILALGVAEAAHPLVEEPLLDLLHCLGCPAHCLLAAADLEQQPVEPHAIHLVADNAGVHEALEGILGEQMAVA